MTRCCHQDAVVTAAPLRRPSDPIPAPPTSAPLPARATCNASPLSVRIQSDPPFRFAGAGGRGPSAALDAEHTAFRPLETSQRAARACHSSPGTTGTVSLVRLPPLSVSTGRTPSGSRRVSLGPTEFTQYISRNTHSLSKSHTCLLALETAVSMATRIAHISRQRPLRESRTSPNCSKRRDEVLGQPRALVSASPIDVRSVPLAELLGALNGTDMHTFR